MGLLYKLNIVMVKSVIFVVQFISTFILVWKTGVLGSFFEKVIVTILLLTPFFPALFLRLNEIKLIVYILSLLIWFRSSIKLCKLESLPSDPQNIIILLFGNLKEVALLLFIYATMYIYYRMKGSSESSGSK